MSVVAGNLQDEAVLSPPSATRASFNGPEPTPTEPTPTMPERAVAPPPAENEEEAEEKKPADPRRAKSVRAALAYAAKRDPAPDVLKPVGRGAFLIWAVILIGLLVASREIPWRTQADAAKDAWSITTKTYSGLLGSQGDRKSTLRRLDRHPENVAKVTITSFAVGTGLFAGYYAAIYLFGIPAVRIAAASGRALHKRVLKPTFRAAGRALERARQKRVVGAGETPAGTQPKLQ